MMAGYPVRVRIGVLSVILFALLSSGLGLRRALEPPQEDISRYEARFRLLRSALPPGGVVGYLTEPPHDDYRRWAFSLTQYALAPLVIIDSTAPALVIGNFQSVLPGGGRPFHPWSSDAVRDAADPTLVPVRDFGDGVLLFRHQPR